MEDLKKWIVGIIEVAVLLLIIALATGKLNDPIAKISGESSMLRGNDTGPTIADNNITVIDGKPVETADEDNTGVTGTTNEVGLESFSETAEVAGESPGQEDLPTNSEPSELDKQIEEFLSKESAEEEWWHEDREYSLYDDSTDREFYVKLHWALEDLGEIQIILTESGEVVADSGVCAFETDAMWSFFDYQGKEGSFYIDDSNIDTLHLFLDDDEIVLPSLEWLQENAS